MTASTANSQSNQGDPGAQTDDGTLDNPGAHGEAHPLPGTGQGGPGVAPAQGSRARSDSEGKARSPDDDTQYGRARRPR